MPGDIPMTVSYATPTLATWMGSMGTGTTLTVDAQTQPRLSALKTMEEMQSWEKARTEKEERDMVNKTRLIRYTVVDADPVLAEKRPELGILLSGTTMLNGMDDKGFVMDLAPKVNEKLAAHNTAREQVEYEDEEGRTKRLKPIRLGQLDVVVEVLKQYA